MKIYAGRGYAVLEKLVYGALGIGFLCLLSTPVYAQGDIEVRLEDEFVWITTDEAELREVLQRVADEIGFKLWVSEKFGQQKISVRIEKKTTDEALKQLLRNQAHALVRNDDAVVTGLYVLPPGESQDDSELPAAGSADQIQQNLLEALNPLLLPAEAKTAIGEQLGAGLLDKSPAQDAPTSESLQQVIPTTESLQQVIDALQNFGATSAEQLPGLLEQPGSEVN